MIRRFVTVLAILLMLAGFSGAVEAISEEDIFVSDPVGRYVVEGEESYLSVNIKNFLPESGLRLVLFKKSDAVVDEVALKCELPVNQLMLVPPVKMAYDRRVVYADSAEMDFDEASKGVYDTVAYYFELRQAVEKLDKYAERTEEVTKLLSDFSYWQTKYMLLFEKCVFKDEIISPSYYVPLSGLESGKYVARFFAGSGVLVKEVNIDVVEEIPQVIPAVELIISTTKQSVIPEKTK